MFAPRCEGRPNEMRNALRMFGVIGFVLVATIALAGPPEMVKIDKAAATA